jgi:hypothetical protein
MVGLLEDEIPPLSWADAEAGTWTGYPRAGSNWHGSRWDSGNLTSQAPFPETLWSQPAVTVGTQGHRAGLSKGCLGGGPHGVP